MVYLVFKLVPIYTEKDDVPKKYLNLRKPKYVTCFKYWYPNVREILEREYGVGKDNKIIVYWTKEISRPGFNKYRVSFKKVWSVKLSEIKNPGLILVNLY